VSKNAQLWTPKLTPFAQAAKADQTQALSYYVGTGPTGKPPVGCLGRNALRCQVSPSSWRKWCQLA